MVSRRRFVLLLFLTACFFGPAIFIKNAKPSLVYSAVIEAGDHRMAFDLATCLQNNYTYVTNPSILFLGDRVLVAARVLRIAGAQGGHSFDTWHSDIVLAQLPASGDMFSSTLTCTSIPLFAANSAWRRSKCQYSFWGGRTQAFGPEDPKLFAIGGDVFVMFGSRRRGLPADCEDLRNQDVLFAQHVLPLTISDQGIAAAGPPVMIRYLPAASSQFGVGPLRDIQKNFAPFEYAGRMHVAFTLQPHVVLALAADGSVIETFTSISNILTDFQHQFNNGNTEIRGNAPATLVDVATLLGPAAQPSSVYLSVLHVQSPPGHYHHYAYTFSAAPPFEILSVSCELPLVARARFHRPGLKPQTAYAGSVAVVGRQLVVAYGSGDSEARVFVGNALDLGIFRGQQRPVHC